MGIIGGRPPGLLLSQLMHMQGIDSVLLEKQSRGHVLGRIRFGVLEQGFAKLMREAQAGERMNGAVIHNAEDATQHDIFTERPYLTYRKVDEIVRVDCDYIVGADGFMA